MPKFAYNQVFFDPTSHRWQYYRIAMSIVGLFLSVAFGATLFSIIRKPALPNLGLATPPPQLRSAPIVPHSVNTLQSPVSSKAAAAPAASNPQSQFLPMTNLPKYSPSVSESYKPKIIGFYVNWYDTSFTSLKTNLASLDELDPEWLHLGDENGNIVEDDPNIQNNTLSYIAQHRHDLPIVPLINNFDQDKQDWNGDMLNNMLANPDARSKTIQNLLDFVVKYKLAGISVDFESVPPAAQPMLNEFMKELYAKFHPLGLEVTQNVPLDDPSFDVKNLSQYSDYLILMAYDEHAPGSDQAGPIASQEWFTNSLNRRMSEIPPQKYIVALGNYGYDWPNNSTDGKEYTFQDAVRNARDANAKISIDPNSLNPTYDYYEKDQLHHVWFLDAATIFNQITAIKKYPFYGYALWRMGSEDPTAWKVLNNRNNTNLDVAGSLRTVTYGYDIDYEGKGEILRVVETPQGGKRDLTYNQDLGLITDETITQYPTPYMVYRWGSTDRKKIALTLDDGPDSVYTPQILSILKQYNVKATFFIVGISGTQNQDILRRIVTDGNEIGNHTFTHPNVTNISDKEFYFELNSVESLLASAVGKYTLLFRPPYAEDVEPVTPDQIRTVLFATNQGYYTVGMHIDPGDWSSPGVDNIVNRVIEGAVHGDGNIVLLHDGGGDRTQTIAALPKIIEGLRAKGFEIVTVSELMGVSPEAVMPPVANHARIISNVSGGAFLATDWGMGILYFFFTAGIILGILRFLFIATLAVIQKIRQRFEKFPAYMEKFRPNVAVIIPAYNEEKVILKTVEAVLESSYQNLGIIVVDDGSTDGTLGVLRQAFDNNPKVKIYTKPNGGKWHALNFGIERTQAQILVTLDADTIFRPATIEKLIQYFSDLRVGAVAGNTKVGNRMNLLTYWQALEYITSQNLDRRAFDIMNCITVVPGSVGAWRRKAVIEAGGFSGRTLAEDADLTFSIIRLGYKVVFQAKALAYTEAPDNVRNFIKQRFRWMYGTLQTAWKHRDALFRPRYGALGFFALPNIFIFQIFFPIISPIMDLTIIVSLIWAGWQGYHHPVDYSALHAVRKLLSFYIFFLIIDFLTSAVAFFLERSEDWTLLSWILLQRFFYRQLMYYVAIKVLLTALRGKIVGWGKFGRKATVSVSD